MDVCCSGVDGNSSSSDYTSPLTSPRAEPPELISAKRALAEGRSFRRKPPIGDCLLCCTPIEARWQAKTLACGHVFHFDCIDALHCEALKVTADLRCPVESCEKSVAPTLASVMVDIRTRRGVPIGKELEEAVNRSPPKIARKPLASVGASLMRHEPLGGVCAEEISASIDKPATDAIDALLRGEGFSNSTVIENENPDSGVHPDETSLGGVNTEIRAQNRGRKPAGKRPRPAGSRPPQKSPLCRNYP